MMLAARTTRLAHCRPRPRRADFVLSILRPLTIAPCRFDRMRRLVAPRNRLTVLETDKTAGRALLSRHMPRTVMKPNLNGPGYLITSGFDLACASAPRTTPPRGPKAPRLGLR